MKQLRAKKSDYLLSLAIFALVLFGLIMIYSVSKYYSLQITDEVSDKLYLRKQLTWLLVGFFAWIVFQSIDYRFWQKKSGLMFFATFILLLLPLIWHASSGGETKGRWIELGFVSFQPAELAKLSIIIYLAGWFSSKGSDLGRIKNMFVPFASFSVMVATFMLLQKDLGTLAVMVFILAVMYFVAGAPLSHLAAGGGIAGFLLWLAIKIEPYRMQRFLTFLNPEHNELGAGYHIKNALIAIGSGGLFGLGFGQSRQKYLYLPEAHTDSIFAIISEELGFFRSIAILLVFALIAIRCYKIAKNAPDAFSRLLVVGISTWLISQMFINIAAMLSLVPLTGIPLPFISYGGSSLVILLASVGILVNVSRHQKIDSRF